MKLVLCTLVLNEMEWLPKLYEQHRNWPDMVEWIFVESADVSYASVNPEMVSADGLSIDGTTEYLTELAKTDSRVTHIKHGFCSAKDVAQAKCEARDRYLEAMEGIKPKYFIVLDADEFYSLESQKDISYLLPRKLGDGFVFNHRDVWYPPYLQEHETPLFQYEVAGGFWDIPYCRAWRWYTGMKHADHNTPCHSNLPTNKVLNIMRGDDFPYMVHMGFASNLPNRVAKHRYYEHRGEANDRWRIKHCDSRRCFEVWTPRTVLPCRARVQFYTGIIPECFQ
jgi:hypothetical protein